jgi:hypothetical protein
VIETAPGDQVPVIDGEGPDVSVDTTSDCTEDSSVPSRNREDRDSPRSWEVTTKDEIVPVNPEVRNVQVPHVTADIKYLPFAANPAKQGEPAATVDDILVFTDGVGDVCLRIVICLPARHTGLGSSLRSG